MASATRSVFYGFGAYVGQLTGRSTCNWWADDPSKTSTPFDPTTLITVDLAKNPEAVRSKQIPLADLQVDDLPTNGGLTKIGPEWPAGSWINGCWLEKGYYDSLGKGIKPPRLHSTDECREYEMTTVLYWDGPLAGRRFWGHYVEIDSEKGTQALVSIFPPGRSLARNQKATRSIWMDLATQAMAIEAGFTEVGVGNAPKKGALFIEAPTLSVLAMDIVKKPLGWGVDRIPEMPK